jgi:hypothetical protein
MHRQISKLKSTIPSSYYQMQTLDPTYQLQASSARHQDLSAKFRIPTVELLDSTFLSNETSCRCLPPARKVRSLSYNSTIQLPNADSSSNKPAAGARYSPPSLNVYIHIPIIELPDLAFIHQTPR